MVTTTPKKEEIFMICELFLLIRAVISAIPEIELMVPHFNCYKWDTRLYRLVPFTTEQIKILILLHTHTLSYCHIGFIIFSGNWLMNLP